MMVMTSRRMSKATAQLECAVGVWCGRRMWRAMGACSDRKRPEQSLGDEHRRTGRPAPSRRQNKDPDQNLPRRTLLRLRVLSKSQLEVAGPQPLQIRAADGP